MLPTKSRADDTKDLKVIATAKETTREIEIGPILPNNRELTVIRSAEELVARSNKPKSAKDAVVQKEMSSALAKLLKVDAIDWTKQMIVVGIVESFETLKSDGKVVTVTYVRHYMRPARAILPSPKVVILTERFEGEVKFVAKETDPKK